MKHSSVSLDDLVGDGTVLDIGAADGALSFFWESLGYRVHAIDFSGSNMNRMEGIRRIAEYFKSAVQIQDQDLDACFTLNRQYGVVFFLGTLYHLKNPIYALETISRNAQFCFISTRVAG
ncbi:MAG: class I SAM-dependent methyltransferase [Bryobacteraceae bacterium]